MTGRCRCTDTLSLSRQKWFEFFSTQKKWISNRTSTKVQQANFRSKWEMWPALRQEIFLEKHFPKFYQIFLKLTFAKIWENLKKSQNDALPLLDTMCQDSWFKNMISHISYQLQRYLKAMSCRPPYYRKCMLNWM